MKLTGKELAICRATGAKWVTRDNNPMGLVCLYTSEEHPRLEFSGCYNSSTEKVAVMCATMFPSLERGNCVKVPAMAPAPEGHEGPEEDRCPFCREENPEPLGTEELESHLTEITPFPAIDLGTGKQAEKADPPYYAIGITYDDGEYKFEEFIPIRYCPKCGRRLVSTRTFDSLLHIDPEVIRKHPATEEESDSCDGQTDEELCSRCGAWAHCELKKAKGDSHEGE